MCYIAFALNLGAVVLNIGIMWHRGGSSPWNAIAVVLGLIGVRTIFPIVRARLRGE